MKNIFTKIIGIISILAALTGYANDKMNPKEAKKTLKIVFDDVRKGHTLSIKKINGAILFSLEIKNSGTYSKLFDVTALENGNYFTELEKDFEIVKRYFTIKNGIVYLENDENIFKPVIRTENNLLLISKISFNKKPLEIILYYNDDVIVWEKLKGRDLINRIYQISESKKGDYRVVINSDDKMYEKEFKI